jgi:hypothetical protein
MGDARPLPAHATSLGEGYVCQVGRLPAELYRLSVQRGAGYASSERVCASSVRLLRTPPALRGPTPTLLVVRNMRRRRGSPASVPCRYNACEGLNFPTRERAAGIFAHDGARRRMLMSARSGGCCAITEHSRERHAPFDGPPFGATMGLASACCRHGGVILPPLSRGDDQMAGGSPCTVAKLRLSIKHGRLQIWSDVIVQNAKR